MRHPNVTRKVADLSLSQADKALQGASGGFSFFGGRSEKYENAADLYVQAANAFRVQRMSMSPQPLPITIQHPRRHHPQNIRANIMTKQTRKLDLLLRKLPPFKPTISTSLTTQQIVYQKPSKFTAKPIRKMPREYYLARLITTFPKAISDGRRIISRI